MKNPSKTANDELKKALKLKMNGVCWDYIITELPSFTKDELKHLEHTINLAAKNLKTVMEMRMEDECLNIQRSLDMIFYEDDKLEDK